MKRIRRLHTFEQIKLLADPRRMQVLRLLMGAPATLTQLAGKLGQSPAWVRHHVRKLEEAGLIELAEIRTKGTVTEKYYRAKSAALLLQELILPESDRPTLVFSGSHDMAVEALAEAVAPYMDVLIHPIGSLDGLVNLRQGICHLSGIHLLDTSGEYNTPFVQRFFPDRAVRLITVAHRVQGLMTAPGNPKNIRSIQELLRTDIRLANRNPGSGTRLWLDAELGQLGVSGTHINGYDQVVATHTAAAELVAGNQADVALGLQAAAAQQQLHFQPLFEERYDLVLPEDLVNTLAPLLDHLTSAAFRQSAQALTGYNTALSGTTITL
ncbi:MAG: helix-turn-helix domain-containing protein [Chloroflexi bacterium]|nr:helix-turn-helix domain-containing protein [Chloroflexota bacterium]